MKAVVISCKAITEEIEHFEDENNVMRNDDLLNDLKSQLSNALTGLMGSAKRHATGNGRTSTSELENSSRNLTDIVYDLVDTCNALTGRNSRDGQINLNVDDLKVS
jgi:hypothetical protein